MTVERVLISLIVALVLGTIGLNTWAIYNSPASIPCCLKAAK